jgi:hypothetical protein
MAIAKKFHELAERFDRLERNGVIEGCSHSSEGPMSREAMEAGKFGEFQEFLFELDGWKTKRDIHQ